MTKDLNDPLSDILGRVGDTVRTSPVRAPDDYKPAAFTEPCRACRGSGKFYSHAGRHVGPCFKCKGAGKLSFKTSPEARAAKQASTLNTRAKSIEAFIKEEPAVFGWISSEAVRNSFAKSLNDQLVMKGSLTNGQVWAVKRAIDKAASYALQREERVAAAPVVDTAGIDRLKAAFDTAIAYSAAKGLKLSPRITINGMTISPAKATSRNPGALYVKARGEYLGKIVGGRFLAADACLPEQVVQVQSFIADPAEAAKVYGQTTGTCCICNATLISEWKHRGIGPICAQKFGW